MSTDPEKKRTTLGEAPVKPFYANTIKAHPGAFDVVLDFGFELGDGSGPIPDHATRVAMSWEHAQALVTVLGGLLSGYQEQLGPLPDIERARVIKGEKP